MAAALAAIKRAGPDRQSICRAAQSRRGRGIRAEAAMTTLAL